MTTTALANLRALLPYTRHRETCIGEEGMVSISCNCGLRDLLAKVDVAEIDRLTASQPPAATGAMREALTRLRTMLDKPGHAECPHPTECPWSEDHEMVAIIDAALASEQPPAAQEAPDGSVTPAMWQKMHHEIVDRLSVMSDTPEARKMMFEALYSSERVAMSLMQPAPASATERDAAVEELREIAQVLAPHAGRHDEAPIDTLRALMRAHPSGEARPAVEAATITTLRKLHRMLVEAQSHYSASTSARQQADRLQFVLGARERLTAAVEADLPAVLDVAECALMRAHPSGEAKVREAAPTFTASGVRHTRDTAIREVVAKIKDAINDAPMERTGFLPNLGPIIARGHVLTRIEDIEEEALRDALRSTRSGGGG